MSNLLKKLSTISQFSDEVAPNDLEEIFKSMADFEFEGFDGEMNRLGGDVEDLESKLAKAGLAGGGPTGEGSRGGKVVGHTPSGKPIYAGSKEAAELQRKPHPGEEQHAAPEVGGPAPQSYEPPEGSVLHYSDPPDLAVYKVMMTLFKKAGMSHRGQVSYNPKSQKMVLLNKEAAGTVKKLYQDFMAEQKKRKAGLAGGGPRLK